MLATNSGSPSGCTTPFSATRFFETLAHSLVGHGGGQPQLHHRPSQQAQGPVVMPCRGWATGQGDQVGLAPVVQLRCRLTEGPSGPLQLSARLIRNTVPTEKASATLDSAPTVAGLEQNPGGRSPLMRTRCWRPSRSSGSQPDSVLFSGSLPPPVNTVCLPRGTIGRSLHITISNSTTSRTGGAGVVGGNFAVGGAVTNTSGQNFTLALSSKDREFISRVIDALNNALAARG